MTDSAYAPQPLTDSQSRLGATLIHLGGIFFYFLPSLVGFVVLGDRGAFIRNETRSALNFQLTMLAGYVIGFVTAWLIVGLFVLLAVVTFTVVFSIMAALAANRGQHWDYPVSIPFIRS